MVGWHWRSTFAGPAEEGLTEAYKSAMRSQLQDWALRQATSASDKTIGIYSGALGYGYNEELLKKKIIFLCQHAGKIC